jgi:hypothetical protein
VIQISRPETLAVFEITKKQYFRSSGMSTQGNAEKLRLRPHHVFCERFSSWILPERGEAFNDLERKIREALGSGTDVVIEVVEGVDDLCRVCPLCQNDRCQSPEGDEDQVRKWDAIVLKGMGVSYGDKLTGKGFSVLIGDKAPLAFCHNQCKLRSACNVSSMCAKE